jgi:hypothetical protein
MTNKSISNYLAPALVLLAVTLVAANWYLQPQRTTSWATAAIVIACMASVLFLVSRRTPNSAPSDAANSIRRGVVFGGLVLVISLGLKLATTLGVINHDDFSKRAVMAIMGVFLMSIGNAMPKSLVPLSAALRCDTARTQAFRRFAGWTWVLTGLVFATVWLVLPLRWANLMTFIVLPSGILIIATQLVRLSRSHDSGAVASRN